MIVSRPTQLGFLYILLFFSGFAGLGYEIVWARMLSVGLGHEILAVFAVIAAFFSGLALGAYSLDGLIARSHKPGRWYAFFELVIAGWSLVLIALIPWANKLVSSLMGVHPSPVHHWAVAFLVPFALLLPATFAMGGTLPAMERLFSRLAKDGWSIGGLYGANTFGAFAGTLLTTFFIIPELGISMTLFMLAITNVLCALGVLLGAARNEEIRVPVVTAIAERIAMPRLYVTLFLTGLLGIGYEVLIVRVLAQILENTVYTFASVLSVYLLGTALGAGLYQRFAPHHGFRPVLTILLQVAAISCLTGIFLLSFASPAYKAILSLVGRSFTGSIIAEFGVALLIFLLPTAVMGAMFSHLAQAARQPDGGLGRALGLNTLGASLAPLLFGVVALPVMGSLIALIMVCLGYLALIPQLSIRAVAPAAVSVAAALALIVTPFQLKFVTVPPGGHVIEHVEGVMATVSVVSDAQDQRYLKVNNHFRMGSTGSAFSDLRQGHIPLLLHPDPKRALFLGLGTGATLAAASEHPGLVTEGVELVPEVLSLIRHFETVTGDLQNNKRLHLSVADARRYVQATEQRYDVVVADLFHPARDGAGSLYTREHFAAIRERLTKDGIFCQWLPLHQLDLETLRIIMRTFLDVYPDASAHIAHYSLQTPLLALVGRTQPLRFGADWMEKRVQDETLRQKLTDLRISSPYSLFGSFIAGRDDLKNFAGTGPLNTDDRPLVVFGAPSSVYSKLGPPSERLLALIERFKPRPGQVLAPSTLKADKKVEERLASYWTARDQFLKAGQGVSQTNDLKKMVQQVRGPLLAAVRQSQDFDAAYMPLLSLAGALHRIDPDTAKELLLELAEANPTRKDAQNLLDRLSSTPR